jgi:hypothetical protein
MTSENTECATMHQAVRNAEIVIRNQKFAAFQLIEDSPPRTVIRELTKNAIEAASQVSPPGRIYWFVEVLHGVPKLGLFNDGPGMSGDELRRLMDLSSTGTGKTQGPDDNFGHGGKVSALKVSPAGVIYRSCKAGRVCQIVLAMEDRPGLDYPVAVKKTHYVEEDGSWETVLDVTEAYADRRDRPLDRDWTEVVLVGKNYRSDTVAPGLVQGATTANWLMRLLNTRFFRFPPGVAVSSANVTTGQGVKRDATGLKDITDRHAERFEEVAAEHPDYGAVEIRYVLLNGRYNVDSTGHSRATTMEHYGIGTRGDHVALVWKDECYEVKTGWSQQAGRFGVLYGSANVAVQIILPDGCAIKNNNYRDALVRRGTNERVDVAEFEELVYRNRPRWLIDYVEEERLRTTSDPSLQDRLNERLKKFLDELDPEPEPRPRVRGAGEESGEEAVCPPDLPGTDNEGAGSDWWPGARKTRLARGKRDGPARGIPEVVFTSDAGILGLMQGRAALYRREDNRVFLDRGHFRYTRGLERMLEEAGADSDRSRKAEECWDESYKFRAGCFVMQAWFYKGKANWTEDDWVNALSTETLTIHLTGPEALQDARSRFRQTFGTGERSKQ